MQLDESRPLNRSQLLQLMLDESVSSQVAGELRFLPFIFKGAMDELIGRLNRGRFQVDHAPFQDYYLVRIRRSSTFEEEVEGKFALFQLNPVVWCLSSPEPSPIFLKCGLGLVQSGTPRTSQIYLSNRDFRMVLEGVANQRLAVEVVRQSHYSRSESNITFPRRRKDFRVLFSELIEEDAALRSVKVLARSGDQVFAKFSISNNGQLSLRRGPMSFFSDQVLSAVARVGEARQLLFANRERRKFELHPLRLIFDRDMLRDKTQNHEFVRVLSKLNKIGVAVFHANPYLHLIVTDFRDGSSFTLFSSSSSSIDVIPSVRASVPSLMRLYRDISERFGECEIGERIQENVTLQEFFA